MEILVVGAAYVSNLLNWGCRSHTAQSYLGGFCPQPIYDVKELASRLSSAATIHVPSDDDFSQIALRWSAKDAPRVNLIVKVGSGADVAETVKYANEIDVPFLARSSGHGAITSLAKMDHGIEIHLDMLTDIKVAADGETARFGGGTLVKKVQQDLWRKGKQTVTGCCECVSLLDPALGGGHGWLQGRHGLIADQFVSMDVVLADGSAQTIDETSELWWAMKGAGHNFAIVTAAVMKVYDVVRPDWATESFVFGGHQVKALYEAINQMTEEELPVDVLHMSFWSSNPQVDPDNPILVLMLFQEDATVVDPKYTAAFHALEPLSTQQQTGTYLSLARWIGATDEEALCSKSGLNFGKFPAYLSKFDIPAQERLYELFKELTRPGLFKESNFVFEGYTTQGVQAVDTVSAAYPFRDAEILAMLVIPYVPGGTQREAGATRLGREIQEVMRNGTGRELRAYVNYAAGEETVREMYGEQWRLEKLRRLKVKYDPQGKFGFFAPFG